MSIRHVLILILSFQGIFFENFSKEQRQYLSNGKEIDQSKVTSPDDWMDISGQHFEDLLNLIKKLLPQNKEKLLKSHATPPLGEKLC